MENQFSEKFFAAMRELAENTNNFLGLTEIIEDAEAANKSEEGKENE